MSSGKISEIFKCIWPPSDGDPVKEMRWRVAITVFCITVGVGLAAHLAWASGNLSPYGFGEGYAKASQMLSVSDSLKDLRKRLIRADIFKMRERQCKAISADEDSNGNRREAAKFYAQEMQRLQDEYRKIVGYQLPLPECRDLIY